MVRNIKMDRQSGGFMAKMRVYELAKELEMANKELLERIGSLGIQVKGHMSSLDDEQANLVRDMVEGRSEQRIEEKRIRRGVIRRRRKIVKTKPEPELVEIPEKVEAPPAEIATDIEVEKVPLAERPADEESAPPLVEELQPGPEMSGTAEAKPAVARATKPAKEAEERAKRVKKVRRKAKKDAAAKIISA